MTDYDVRASGCARRCVEIAKSFIANSDQRQMAS